MPRMKVTVVTHAYLAEENRKKLALLAREVELEVVSPDRARTPLFRYRIETPVIEQDGYTMRFFRPLPAAAGIPARYVLWSRDLGLRRFQPDVVHVEGEPWTLLAQQALWCARCHAPQAAVVCTVRQNTYTTYGPLTGLKDWLGRRAIPRIDRFLAGNSGSRRILEDRFAVSADKIALNLQLGVDTDHFRPVTPREKQERRRRWGLADDAVAVGYCGRLVEEKGLLDLCQAAQATQRHPGARLQLALLGDGPLRARLEAAAGENLALHPVVPHAEVASFLQALDVFVLPSAVLPAHEEHDAHSLLEAMACGLPCVGTTSGVIPEILSGAGLLVPPSAPAALEEAMAQLLEPEKRRKEGEAARQRVLERFSNQRVVDKQVETYLRAIEERRRAATSESNYTARTAYQHRQAAEEYEDIRFRSRMGRLRRRREQAAVRRVLAELPAMERIADIPCGVGRWAPVLGERAERIFGLDISWAMLERARAEHGGKPPLTLARAEAERLPLADGSVDIVFCFALMKHLPPEAKRAVLAEFARVSRRGLVVSFALFNPVTYLRWRWTMWRQRRSAGATVHSYPLWPGELSALAGELGFRVRRRAGVLGWLSLEKVLYLEKATA